MLTHDRARRRASSAGRSSSQPGGDPRALQPDGVEHPGAGRVQPRRRVARPLERGERLDDAPRRAPTGRGTARARRRARPCPTPVMHRVRQLDRARPTRRTASAPPVDRAGVHARPSSAPVVAPAAAGPSMRSAGLLGHALHRGERGLDRGDRADPVASSAALRICSPSVRPPRPCGVLITKLTLPSAIRSTAVELGALADLADDQVDRLAEAGEVRRRCPAVAAMPRPSSRSRLATTRPAGLSPSASDRNTVPVGRQHRAGGQLGLEERLAERAVDAHHLAGRAHLRAERGVDLGEAVERQHRLLDRDVRRACDGGAQQALGRAARPAWRRASPGVATLASGTPVALATNGTVRLARGLASMTYTVVPVHRVLHVDQAAHVERARRSSGCRPRSPRPPTAAASAAGSRRPSRRCARRPPRRAPSRRRSAPRRCGRGSRRRRPRWRPRGSGRSAPAARPTARPRGRAMPKPASSAIAAARWSPSWTICIARPPST